MVLPSDEHAALRAWLARWGVDTSEVGGYLLAPVEDALFVAVGSDFRLAAADHQVLDRARSAAETAAACEDPGPVLLAQGDDVTAVLNMACQALRAVGIGASPFRGLGVIFGGEVLYGMVQIENPAGLYVRMRAV
jgi:hypothetical protein